jgi:arylsulfatase A
MSLAKFASYVCTCLILLGAGLLYNGCSSAPDKPNVVIFFTDDQGTLDVNCFGSTDLYTPNMDQLAEEGVRFTQAYAHTVCCPSRALLMTGRHPQRSNVNSWTQGNPKVPGNNMFLSEITIAEVLKDAGYRTGLVGKWHLGADFEHGPMRQGFDEFFGIRDGFIDNYSHTQLHWRGNNEPYHDLYRGTQELFRDGEYFPDLMVEEANAFLDRNSDGPFFLYFPLNIPHYPEQADEQFNDRYSDMPMPRQSYARMVSTTDDRIGKIMQKLEDLGVYDNTLIIFMSDNGHSAEDYQEENGRNYGANGGGGNTGKWIGNKGTLYEGGIRTPAIIRYPKALPNNVVRDQAITAADFYPTILDICGVPQPNVTLDGKSLLPIIKSATKRSHHTVMHWQWIDNWAVRDGDWKLILQGKRGKLKFHLGTLAGDQPEVVNYAEQHPEVVDRLTKLHEEWVEEVMPEGAGQ